jgi:hypothetical protein
MRVNMTAVFSIRLAASRAPRAFLMIAGAALSLALGACAQQGASRHFDVDAFLRASDTALPEVLANPDFLKATRISVTDCAAMLQSASSGVLEPMPPTVRGSAWVLHPTATPDKVWLVTSRSDGERSCHGPLPADAMKALMARSAG